MHTLTNLTLSASICLQTSRAYRNLSPRTRLFIGGGVMLYAGLGLLLSDKAEQTFGFTPTEEDKQKLREIVPKVHFVDKDK